MQWFWMSGTPKTQGVGRRVGGSRKGDEREGGNVTQIDITL